MRELYDKLVEASNIGLVGKLLISESNLNKAFNQMLIQRGFSQDDWAMYFLFKNTEEPPLKLRVIQQSYWRMKSSYYFKEPIEYEHFEKMYNVLYNSNKKSVLKRIQFIELFYKVTGIYFSLEDIDNSIKEIEHVL